MSYTANTPAQRDEMLRACGLSSVDELFSDIPEALAPRSFDIPPGLSELELDALFKQWAARNEAGVTCFAGGGVYDHFIPAAVDEIASRNEFYTSYTPYQPEVSQGTLQAIYEYQTQICRLTGMDVANASLYDGGTALHEACKMAMSITGRNRLVVDGCANPIYRAMLQCHLSNAQAEIVTVAPRNYRTARKDILAAVNSDTAATVVQNPNFFGAVENHSEIAQRCHERGALAIQSVYPIALALLKTPAEMGMDIVTGEGQCLGMPLSFGGPCLGIIAARRDMVRKLPGRLCGRTVDRNGKEAFVLTLQTREQHVRREKATSNICTNQALCALRAHAYLSLLGKQGLRQVADLCRAGTAYAGKRLQTIKGAGIPDYGPVFNEFVVEMENDISIPGMAARGFMPGVMLGGYYPGMPNRMLVAVTEKRTQEQIDAFAEALGAAC